MGGEKEREKGKGDLRKLWRHAGQAVGMESAVPGMSDHALIRRFQKTVPSGNVKGWPLSPQLFRGTWEKEGNAFCLR